MEDIPVIHIYNEDDEERYIYENRFKIHSRILKGVESAIKNNDNNIVLFKIINHMSNYTVMMTVSKDNWEESLDKCMKFFIKEEEYEYCEKIKTLQGMIKNGNI